MVDFCNKMYFIFHPVNRPYLVESGFSSLSMKIFLFSFKENLFVILQQQIILLL